MNEIIELIKKLQIKLNLNSNSEYGETIENVVKEMLRIETKDKIISYINWFNDGNIILNGNDENYYYYIDENNKIHVYPPDEEGDHFGATNEEIKKNSEESKIKNIIDLLWDVFIGKEIYIQK